MSRFKREVLYRNWWIHPPGDAFIILKCRERERAIFVESARYKPLNKKIAVALPEG